MQPGQLIFFTFLSWAGAAPDNIVTQSPPVTMFVGQNVEINCAQTGSWDYMHWYQQIPGESLKFILYIQQAYGAQKPFTSEIPARFNVSRPDIRNCSLMLNSLRVSDSAVYFCAATVRDTVKLIFGSGTRLKVVANHAITAPSAFILPPSATDIERGENVSLGCLLTSFYPDSLIVTWNASSHSVSEGNSLKFGAAVGEGGYYSLVSQMRTSLKSWDDGNSFTCQADLEKSKRTTSVMSKEKARKLQQECLQVDSDDDEPPSSLPVIILSLRILFFKSLVFNGLMTSTIWVSN
ncbi:immunoglobulin lambda-1 light chain-like [Cetorhinus maximus]